MGIGEGRNLYMGGPSGSSGMAEPEGRDSGMAQAFATLDAQLAELASQVDALSQALIPVRRPMPRAAEGEDKMVGRPPHSPMAEAVTKRTAEVRRAVAALGLLRVELDI